MMTVKETVSLKPSGREKCADEVQHIGRLPDIAGYVLEGLGCCRDIATLHVLNHLPECPLKNLFEWRDVEMVGLLKPVLPLLQVLE